LTCFAVVTVTSAVAHADETPPKTTKSDAPYEWLAPLMLAGTSAGAMTLAHAEGMDWGRVGLDSALSTVGFGVGLGVSVWLAYVSRHERFDKLVLGVVALTAAATFGGIGLGEVITGHEPFPKGTSWPSAGGLTVGAVIDIGAIVAIANAQRENTALTVVMAVLVPLVIGTTSVAGFSLGLPKP
jgi:hypothetical protein